LFRLSLRLITFGGRSAHLAYLVHKSGRKTSIIIIIMSEGCFISHIAVSVIRCHEANGQFNTNVINILGMGKCMLYGAL